METRTAGTGSREDGGVQVISRAAAILRLLGREPGGHSLGRIAARTGLPRSTVQRIVGALAAEELVSAGRGRGGVRLGPGVHALAQAASRDVRERMRPLMRRVADETGETVDLAVLDGARMLFVDQVVGRHRLRAVSHVGETFPLATTANGKAALAAMEPDEAARLVRAETGTARGAARRGARILRELDAIRKGGLALDENEHTGGICALGFALRDEAGEIHAVSTPVPSPRFASVRRKLAAALRDCRRAALAEGLDARAASR